MLPSTWSPPSPSSPPMISELTALPRPRVRVELILPLTAWATIMFPILPLARTEPSSRPLIRMLLMLPTRPLVTIAEFPARSPLMKMSLIGPATVMLRL